MEDLYEAINDNELEIMALQSQIEKTFDEMDFLASYTALQTICNEWGQLNTGSTGLEAYKITLLPEALQQMVTSHLQSANQQQYDSLKKSLYKIVLSKPPY